MLFVYKQVACVCLRFWWHGVFLLLCYGVCLLIFVVVVFLVVCCFVFRCCVIIGVRFVCLFF